MLAGAATRAIHENSELEVTEDLCKLRLLMLWDPSGSTRHPITEGVELLHNVLLDDVHELRALLLL